MSEYELNDKTNLIKWKKEPKYSSSKIFTKKYNTPIN